MKDQRLLPEQIGKNSRRSYNSYRAALVWCTILEVDRLSAELSDRVAGMSADQVHEMLDRIETEVDILHRYPPGSNTMPSLWQAPAGGAVRKSKRCGLGTLPALWRQQLLQACPPASPYFVPLIVLMLTGLRPEELRKSV
jgi:hypothetical protein